MNKHIDQPALQTDLADNPIDALLAGVPLEMLPVQYNLSEQDWQALEMADQLASTDLASHSQIRGALKLYMTQEIAAQQETYEAQARRKGKKRWSVSPWLIITGVIIMLIVMVMIVFLIDSAPPPDSFEYAGAPSIADDPDFYAGESQYGYPVYTLDGIVFGDLFTLSQMIVKTDDYGNSTDGIMLVFNLARPVRSGRYSIVLDKIYVETMDSHGAESFRLIMPNDQRLTFAVEYDLYYDYVQPSYFYRLEIVDTETSERLTLPSGADFFELRPVPASIEPASDTGIVDELPTAAPPSVTPES
ncbi:MAG: hypothetical protein JXJ17_18415 [Anaerolineae bacterium]|nr:hypothetical protein [Anaerolineae bacterium]